jgi:uncharacterized protein (DUF1330 family)
MPKGYWIARLDVTDAETYKAYVKANAEAFAKYGAKFLTRGGPFTALEGQNRSRNVVLEFESVETALACYHSPEYQRAFEMRKNAAVADIVIMAGYDGPQPPEQPGDAAKVNAMGSLPLKSSPDFVRRVETEYNYLMGGALA